MYPIDSQSTERAVQEVSTAAAWVCGADKSDGFIRACLAHREVIPVFISEKDAMVIFNRSVSSWSLINEDS